MESILKILWANADEKYADFTAKLVPNIPREKVIGVRAPIMKQIAKDVSKSPLMYDFLGELPHEYLEENGLHAALLSYVRDPERAKEELERFLPYVDNWAVSDTITVNALYRDEEKLFNLAKEWIADGREYHIRVAIRQLMKCKRTAFCDEHLSVVASVKDERYYVKMMVAWYFATALSFRFDAAAEYLKNGAFETWVHNKTIQKAIESYRITDEQKSYLRTLKRKDMNN